MWAQCKALYPPSSLAQFITHCNSYHNKVVKARFTTQKLHKVRSDEKITDNSCAAVFR